MAEFVTPIKKIKPVDSDIVTIPPSPFLNRLGYGTGNILNISFMSPLLTYLLLKTLTYNMPIDICKTDG